MASAPAGKLPAAAATGPGQGHNRVCPYWMGLAIRTASGLTVQLWADDQITEDTRIRQAGTAHARMRSTRKCDVFMALIMPSVLIVMAVLIGTMAYLMITAIFQTISNLG